MKTTLAFGAIIGLLAIPLDTTLHHVLSTTLPQHAIKTLTIAIHYQQYYALLITLLSLLIACPIPPSLSRRLQLSLYPFICGTVLFCGSIEAHYLAHFTPPIPVAPIGGTLLMLGWLILLSITFLKHPPPAKDT